MAVTSDQNRGVMSGTVRLRRDVYDSLIQEKRAATIDDQVRLTGINRRTLYRILGGRPPSLASAIRMSDALGVPMSALFKRIEDAA